MGYPACFSIKYFASTINLAWCLLFCVSNWYWHISSTIISNWIFSRLWMGLRITIHSWCHLSKYQYDVIHVRRVPLKLNVGKSSRIKSTWCRVGMFECFEKFKTAYNEANNVVIDIKALFFNQIFIVIHQSVWFVVKNSINIHRFCIKLYPPSVYQQHHKTSTRCTSHLPENRNCWTAQVWPRYWLHHRPHSRQVTGARCTGGRSSPVMSWILFKANNAQQASGVGDKRFFHFKRNVQHLWTSIIRHHVNDITHQQVMRFNQWSKFANIS